MARRRVPRRRRIPVLSHERRGSRRWRHRRCRRRRGGRGCPACGSRCWLVLVSVTAEQCSHLRRAATGKLSHLSTGTEDVARAGVHHVAAAVGLGGGGLNRLLRLRGLLRGGRRSSGSGRRRAGVIRDGQFADGSVSVETVGKRASDTGSTNLILSPLAGTLNTGSDKVKTYFGSLESSVKLGPTWTLCCLRKRTKSSLVKTMWCF